MNKIPKLMRNNALTAARKLRTNMTNSEKLLWNKLRNRGLNGLKFYRQRIFFVSYLDKLSFYIADFYCHEKCLVVEVDGKIHDLQKERDEIRDIVMHEHGLHVLRITNEEVENDIKGCLHRIAEF